MAVASCDIPNLEKPQCIEARDAVRRFYSFHFGNDMHPSPEYLKLREEFIAPDWLTQLRLDAAGEPRTAEDYFTKTENFPKAFRVGECTARSETQVTLQVLLLWRDDTTSEQKEVQVDAIKTNDKWLVNYVSKPAN